MTTLQILLYYKKIIFASAIKKKLVSFIRKICIP